MREILETIIFITSALVPVSVMWPAAWLLYKGVKGAGWYLIAATLIAGSTHITFDGFGG